MWKGFDSPVVNNPAVGPVTEVSPAAAAAVEAIAPVADTNVHGESGRSDQAEVTHDSMQDVQEEEPEPQEGTTQAHVSALAVPRASSVCAGEFVKGSAILLRNKLMPLPVNVPSDTSRTYGKPSPA